MMTSRSCSPQPLKFSISPNSSSDDNNNNEAIEQDSPSQLSEVKFNEFQDVEDAEEMKARISAISEKFLDNDDFCPVLVSVYSNTGHDANDFLNFPKRLSLCKVLTNLMERKCFPKGDPILSDEGFKRLTKTRFRSFVVSGYTGGKKYSTEEEAKEEDIIMNSSNRDWQDRHEFMNMLGVLERFIIEELSFRPVDELIYEDNSNDESNNEKTDRLYTLFRQARLERYMELELMAKKKNKAKRTKKSQQQGGEEESLEQELNELAVAIRSTTTGSLPSTITINKKSSKFQHKDIEGKNKFPLDLRRERNILLSDTLNKQKNDNKNSDNKEITTNQSLLSSLSSSSKRQKRKNLESVFPSLTKKQTFSSTLTKNLEKKGTSSNNSAEILNFQEDDNNNDNNNNKITKKKRKFSESLDKPKDERLLLLTSMKRKRLNTDDTTLDNDDEIRDDDDNGNNSNNNNQQNGIDMESEPEEVASSQPVVPNIEINDDGDNLSLLPTTLQKESRSSFSSSSSYDNNDKEEEEIEEIVSIKSPIEKEEEQQEREEKEEFGTLEYGYSDGNTQIIPPPPSSSSSISSSFSESIYEPNEIQQQDNSKTIINNTTAITTTTSSEIIQEDQLLKSIEQFTKVSKQIIQDTKQTTQNPSSSSSSSSTSTSSSTSSSSSLKKSIPLLKSLKTNKNLTEPSSSSSSSTNNNDSTIVRLPSGVVPQEWSAFGGDTSLEKMFFELSKDDNND